MERYLYILYERLSIIKLTIFHREIYQLNVIPIKIKIVLFDNLILTFILNIKNQNRARNILQKKNKLEGISATCEHHSGFPVPPGLLSYPALRHLHLTTYVLQPDHASAHTFATSFLPPASEFPCSQQVIGLCSASKHRQHERS